MQKAQAILQYATPAVVLFYYVGAAGFVICTLQKGPKMRRNRSLQIIFWGLYFTIATYFLQSGILIIDSLSAAPRISSVAANVNAISNSLLWSILAALLHLTKRPVWYPYLGSCFITLVMEVTICGLFASHHTISRAVDYVLLVIQTCRSAALLVLLVTHATARFRPRSLWPDEESTSLLRQPDEPGTGDSSYVKPAVEYGSVAVTCAGDASPTDDEDSDSGDSVYETAKKRIKMVDERLQKDGNWFTYLQGFTVFIPLIWPSNRPRIYFNMLGYLVCVLCGRVLGVLKPRQLGIIVNILTSGSGSLYTAIGLYVLLGWASSSAGIKLIEQCLWLPIEQYSEVAISTAAYNKIMELSSDFHDNKQSGELYQSIAQGSSVNNLLEILLFNLGPMILDLVVGYGYLYHLFGPYMTLIAAATTVGYLSSTTYFSTKESRYRRKAQALGRKASQIMYDTVGSWATVTYFNRVSYEEDRYERSRTLYIATQQLYYLFGNFNYSISGCTVELGLWAALVLAAYQVSHGVRTAGDFVTLMSYWSLFAGPIWYFGYAHKTILRYLVDAEQLLSLLQLKPKVKDGAGKFLIKGGAIQFKDVKFSYDASKQIIKGVNFTAQPGQKIALVGETGGGKSTLLKLLFRFYDVTEGSVLIDGQDVREVTLESLRACVGVVPQDPSMFNTTVMDNVRYSKLDATDEEVMEACKAAAVHDKVLSFSDGYASKVGEKGVKLSGGELQRLAIARAILKDPDVILLDEATSSVDTETESRIQSALKNLTNGRTTFTVAHRLSTVVDADIVLVIKDGTIIEQGPPQTLLTAKGKFYDLWCKQVGIVNKVPETMTGNTQGDGHENSGDEPPAQAGTSEHRKAWRPDAPEFIPRHLRDSTSSEKQDDQQKSKDANGTNAKSSNQQPEEGDLPPSKLVGQGKSQGKRQRAQEAKGSATTTGSDGAVDATSSPNLQETDIVANEPDGNLKRARFSRVRRRKMLKSEPTDASVSFAEGVLDANDAPEGSGEGSATPRRHVSAPVKPGPTADDNMTVQGRRNRRKHWRGRNGASSHRQSDRSAQTSGTWSAASGTATPAAPATTPEKSDRGIGAAGCQIAIKLYTLATQISTASDRISSISNDVSLTSGVLQQLGELMTQKAADDGTTIFSQSGLETTKTSAAMCEAIFKDIEQAAGEASKQIRGRSSLVGGKIKLSKSEKAKWPFLQPSIETLRNELREAKGTLMLMLQVTSLALSKKMADSHQRASTKIVEQREIIGAILALQIQQQGNATSEAKSRSVDSSSNCTPRPASRRTLDKENSWPYEEETLAQPSVLSSIKSLPMRSNVLITLPGQNLPAPTTSTKTSTSNDTEILTSERCATKNRNDNDDSSVKSGSNQSIRGGCIPTPSETTIDEEERKSTALDLFMMKPEIRDVADVIQLSWKIHKVQMQQAQIQKQVTRAEEEGLPAMFEIYQDLYTHEHKAVDNEISKAAPHASLISLKRTHVDMWHREIFFKGVPGLQFVLERVIQRSFRPSLDQEAHPWPIKARDTQVTQQVDASEMEAREISVANGSSFHLDTDLDNMEGISDPTVLPPMLCQDGMSMAKPISEEQQKEAKDHWSQYDPGEWNAPDSWAVKKVCNENMLVTARQQEIDEDGDPPWRPAYAQPPAATALPKPRPDIQMRTDMSTDITKGSHVVQDYQTQLMLLEQQKQKRLLMARQEQETSHGLHGQPMYQGESPLTAAKQEQQAASQASRAASTQEYRLAQGNRAPAALVPDQPPFPLGPKSHENIPNL
ncbi:MAG: hypothetical protein Q9181_006647, partial [Wetmoreana brouardii]